MRVVLSKTGRYVAKLTLQVVPSVTASVLGGYLLAQLHVASSSSSNDPPSRVTGVSADTAHDGVLRAEVKPLETKGTETRSAEAKSAETRSAETKSGKAKPAAPVAVAEKEKPSEKAQDKIADKSAKARTEARTETRTTVAAANPRATEPYKPIPYDPEPSSETLYVAPPAQAPAAASLATRPMPQAPAETAAQPAPKPSVPAAAMPQPQAVASAVPPPASPSQAAPALPPPTALSPVSVMASAPVDTRAAEVVVKPEPRRQQVAREDSRGVFSTISSAAGTAANATGDTINWVFGLPGKLIGRGDSDAPAPPPEPRRLM